MNVNSFMQGLFRQGAFKGSSARDAYFVQCDASTTSQTDMDLGIVNIVIGFAPLKPAEFVVISLKQMVKQAA
jgi:phage tail sheath protein FI